MSPVLPGEVRDGDPRPSSPACPANPVDVFLDVPGEVEVYDVRDVFDVDAT